MEAETGAEAGTGAGTQASRTALKIRYKSFSEYLGIIVAAGGELARGFSSKGPTGWSDNSSPDLEGRKESGRATEGAMEGATEGRSRRGCLRFRTEVILGLELIFFYKHSSKWAG